MVRFRHRRLVAAVALVCVVTVVLPASNALAATPIAGISYNGSSAHGLYTVSFATSCVANNATVSAVCVQPSFVNINVSPTTKIGAKCDAYGGLAMGYIPIKAGGTFLSRITTLTTMT